MNQKDMQKYIAGYSGFIKLGSKEKSALGYNDLVNLYEVKTIYNEKIFMIYWQYENLFYYFWLKGDSCEDPSIYSPNFFDTLAELPLELRKHTLFNLHIFD